MHKVYLPSESIYRFELYLVLSVDYNSALLLPLKYELNPERK